MISLAQALCKLATENPELRAQFKEGKRPLIHVQKDSRTLGTLWIRFAWHFDVGSEEDLTFELFLVYATMEFVGFTMLDRGREVLRSWTSFQDNLTRYLSSMKFRDPEEVGNLPVEISYVQQRHLFGEPAPLTIFPQPDTDYMSLVTSAFDYFLDYGCSNDLDVLNDFDQLLKPLNGFP